MDATPRRRLRWYQYSLRSLFALTVLVAIAGSWFAWKRQQKERERAAVKWVEEEGGVVEYGWEVPSAANSNPQPPGPAWLRAWLGDDFFAHVGIVAFPPNAATDDGLEHLKGLTQVRRLYLDNSKVTDAGMEHLKGLTQLKRLYFENTQVTDAGLEHLRGLTRLESLDLRNTKVTDEGVKKLQEALPNCNIVR